MSQRTKYSFDTVFDGTGNVVAAPQPRPKSRFSREEVEAIRQEAYEAGQHCAEAKAAEEMARALDQVASATAALLNTLRIERDGMREEAISIAALAARKLAAALIGREPEAAIAELIESCLEHMRGEPRIVVRVSESLVETVRTRIDDIAKAHHFDGRFIVLGEEAFRGADARIEWSNGGFERDISAIEQAIDDLIERYLATAATEESEQGEGAARVA
jgi:flagellar assembly protein FliH